jgi:adenylate kinase family enzyme
MNDSTTLARFHIIGGPGSGKTTLARRIAVITGAPLYELDSVGYENGAGTRRPLEDKLVDVHAIAEQPAWITEGIFLMVDR